MILLVARDCFKDEGGIQHELMPRRVSGHRDLLDIFHLLPSSARKPLATLLSDEAAKRSHGTAIYLAIMSPTFDILLTLPRARVGYFWQCRPCLAVMTRCR